MRICLVIRALPCHRLGGLEFHTWDLAQALTERGHRIVLLTSAHPLGKHQETLPCGTEIHYSPGGRPGDYSLSFFLQAERKLRELETSAGLFDVVHCQEFAGLFLQKRPGRSVTTVHGTLYSETALDRRYFRRLSWLGKLEAVWRFKHRLPLHLFMGRLLRNSDALIVDSEYTWRQVALSYAGLGHKLHHVPLGIDVRRYLVAKSDHQRDPGTLRIVLLGRLQRMKGLSIVLQAAALLKQRGIGFRMDVGGSGDFEQEMQQEIEMRDLTRHVVLHGRVAVEALPDFLTAGDVFLFPDLTQPAFGLVAVEAMWYGLPVVAARSGAIPEVVTEATGWLYEPWNVEELASLLSRITVERNQLELKAMAVKSHAAKFIAARMAEETEAVYKECMQPL